MKQSESTLAENQRVKANDARKDGIIRDIIVDVLRTSGGAAHRQDFLDQIPEQIDMTLDEVNAKHEVLTKSGEITERNYFVSVVDWVLSDMRVAEIIEPHGSGMHRLLDMDITDEEVLNKLSNAKRNKTAKKKAKAKMSSASANMILTNGYYRKPKYMNSFSSSEQIQIGMNKDSIFKRLIAGETLEDILDSYRKIH